MRVMIDISYDGTNFEGFATQPHGRTISDHLMQALSLIYKQDIYIYGSSRTDSKVSALQQYIVYDSPFYIAPDAIKSAINANINEAIYCKSALYVNDDYFPRYDVSCKTYTYTITTKYNPLMRNFEYYIKRPLDVKAMQDAAKCLVGTHDFTSFCAANSDVKSKIRTITNLNIKKENERIIITISGDGFLYNMIRIIAGTLIVIGIGKADFSQMEKILAAKDRKAAYYTAAAHGLCLQKIELKGNYEQK